MHTLLARANAVSAFSLSTLAALTFFCFASTFFINYSAPVSISAANIVLKNVPEYAVSREKNDLGALRFDLNTDLTPLFNWNTKQLFLYLTAEYQTQNNKVNQVVLWDKIIQRGEASVVKLKNQHLKYYFWDDGNGLLGHKNVSLYLSWNIIPIAGTLPTWSGTGVYKLAFPSEYTQGRSY
ncbi:signal peptidase complex subunit 3 [Penaeus vannamei]|uniref:Signal peptidase complex subunit 3 n=1 Tax=Penaeus vannamei TaxID=6689 RepID=A0A423TCW6_PENVA|nr:signal peptidase complex subunit 3-like [Penaeus vannamei]ROT74292.1 putative signal peptidase complex subunit 3 [Penaeus vannamei]